MAAGEQAVIFSTKEGLDFAVYPSKIMEYAGMSHNDFFAAIHMAKDKDELEKVINEYKNTEVLKNKRKQEKIKREAKKANNNLRKTQEDAISSTFGELKNQLNKHVPVSVRGGSKQPKYDLVKEYYKLEKEINEITQKGGKGDFKGGAVPKPEADNLIKLFNTGISGAFKDLNIDEITDEEKFEIKLRCVKLRISELLKEKIYEYLDNQDTPIDGASYKSLLKELLECRNKIKENQEMASKKQQQKIQEKFRTALGVTNPDTNLLKKPTDADPDAADKEKKNKIKTDLLENIRRRLIIYINQEYTNENEGTEQGFDINIGTDVPVEVDETAIEEYINKITQENLHKKLGATGDPTPENILVGLDDKLFTVLGLGDEDEVKTFMEGVYKEIDTNLETTLEEAKTAAADPAAAKTAAAEATENLNRIKDAYRKCNNAMIDLINKSMTEPPAANAAKAPAETKKIKMGTFTLEELKRNLDGKTMIDLLSLNLELELSKFIGTSKCGDTTLPDDEKNIILALMTNDFSSLIPTEGDDDEKRRFCQKKMNEFKSKRRQAIRKNKLTAKCELSQEIIDFALQYDFEDVLQKDNDDDASKFIKSQRLIKTLNISRLSLEQIKEGLNIFSRLLNGMSDKPQKLDLNKDYLTHLSQIGKGTNLEIKNFVKKIPKFLISKKEEEKKLKMEALQINMDKLISKNIPVKGGSKLNKTLKINKKTLKKGGSIKLRTKKNIYRKLSLKNKNKKMTGGAVPKSLTNQFTTFVTENLKRRCQSLGIETDGKDPTEMKDAIIGKEREHSRKIQENKPKYEIDPETGLEVKLLLDIGKTPKPKEGKKNYTNDIDPVTGNANGTHFGDQYVDSSTHCKFVTQIEYQGIKYTAYYLGKRYILDGQYSLEGGFLEHKDYAVLPDTYLFYGGMLLCDNTKKNIKNKYQQLKTYREYGLVIDPGQTPVKVNPTSVAGNTSFQKPFNLGEMLKGNFLLKFLPSSIRSLVERIHHTSKLNQHLTVLKGFDHLILELKKAIIMEAFTGNNVLINTDINKTDINNLLNTPDSSIIERITRTIQNQKKIQKTKDKEDRRELKKFKKSPGIEVSKPLDNPGNVNFLKDSMAAQRPLILRADSHI